ncbi:MAG: bifunctional hydroxymethylpyrimidine kinase/phosphomethylpyrimidine kinase [Actinobacteria bacterium]|nr:bifunctional hydroxymethylpyrimidine kinase/phosphomethylpyrimidine kinase [Actinomycetota bacterium]
MNTSRVLTIGGSDPSGGAGIQVDLMTFMKHKVFGYTAITAVTAQNSCKVKSIHPVPSEMLTDQIQMILLDSKMDAVKTGMLGSRKNIEVIANVFDENPIENLIVDPIFETSSGQELLSAGAYSILKIRLLPLAKIVTPNIPEAERLAGIEIKSVADMKEAAKNIHFFGSKFVLVKGGHLSGNECVDVLFDGSKFTEFISRRHEFNNVRGTGCIFSAALACRLASKLEVPMAVRMAKDFVLRSISNSKQIGKGARQVSPFVALEKKVPAGVN